jgi:hypothetical protein
MLAQQDPAEALHALQAISVIDGLDGAFAPGLSQFAGGAAAPQCGCIPPPSLGLSGAPAGQGLQKNPEGWPQGAVRTAGGYTVVPEGSTNWSIYGPDQKPGEKPTSRIWGDPHVDEKDGTRWDFTKNSDFLLPDGTRINCQTSSEKGQSVSTGLTITNGADRVNITGIDGQPSTGDVTPDGYDWRAQHLAANPGRDTFRLGGTSENVQWFKESGGKDQGLITGSTQDGESSYQQVTEGSQKYWVDPSLRPPMGSPAWGNELRGNIADQLGQIPMLPEARSFFSSWLGVDDAVGRFQNDFGFNPFGGLNTTFPSWSGANDSVGALGDVMLYQYSQQQALLGLRMGAMMV